MASDIWLRTILIVRKETRCRHIGYSYRLTARVLLYAPYHRQDNTYHGLCYTSRGALAGTRNSSMGPPYEGSIRRPIAPWANALPLSYVPLPLHNKTRITTVYPSTILTPSFLSDIRCWNTTIYKVQTLTKPSHFGSSHSSHKEKKSIYIYIAHGDPVLIPSTISESLISIHHDPSRLVKLSFLKDEFHHSWQCNLEILQLRSTSWSKHYYLTV